MIDRPERIARPAVALGMLLWMGCAMADNVIDPKTVETVTVTAEIFSGRPNPSWTLTGTARDEAIARVAALAGGAPKAGAAPLEGLGYHGVTATLARPGAAPIRVTTWKGVATLGADARIDADRALEKWLIATGRDHLDATLRDSVEADLAR